MRIFMVLVSALGFLISGVAAADQRYYCDCASGASMSCVAGDDRFAGDSINTPRQSAQKLAEDLLSAKPGDQFLLCRGGVFNVRASLKLTLSAQNNTFTLSDYYPGWAAENEARPLLRQLASDLDALVLMGGPSASSPAGGYTVRDINILCAAPSGCAHGVKASNVVTDVNLEDMVLQGQFKTGVYLDPAGGSASNHHRKWTLKNMSIYDTYCTSCLAFGFHGAASDLRIEDVYFDGNGGGDRVNGNALRIANVGFPVKNVKVVHSGFTRSGWSEKSARCDAGHIAVNGQVQNLEIRQNLIREEANTAGSSCAGILVVPITGNKHGFTEVNISHNLMYNVGRTCIGLVGGDEAVVENNICVIENSASDWRFFADQAVISDASDVAANGEIKIRNNALLIHRDNSGSGEFLDISRSGGGRYQIHNNLIEALGYGNAACYNIGGQQQISNFSIDNNLCHAPNASTFAWNRGSAMRADDLSAWKAGVSMDASSVSLDPELSTELDYWNMIECRESPCLEVPALLRDAVKISDTSPALNRGNDSNAALRDFFLNVRVNMPDIGVNEYAGKTALGERPVLGFDSKIDGGGNRLLERTFPIPPAPVAGPNNDLESVGGASILTMMDTKVRGATPLMNGAVINTNDLPDLYNIRADTEQYSSIRSVRMALKGPTSILRMENDYPFTLVGRDTNFIKSGPKALLPGSYTLEMTPYSKPDGKGRIGPNLKVSFSLRAGGATVSTPSPTPTPTPTSAATPPPTTPPPTTMTPGPTASPIITNGWTDFVSSYLVSSDGTYSLGDPSRMPNSTRDKGSKIAYFDVATGNNQTAEVYWFRGGKIVDSKGRASNSEGALYGTDPLQPNLRAIKPFKAMLSAGDPRLRTQNNGRYSRLSGQSPDWFLFRRGQTHTEFDDALTGGRSEAEPMVIASYGPLSDARAIIEPADSQQTPFGQHNFGNPISQLHIAVKSLELRTPFSFYNFHKADSPVGGPVTAYVEDVYFNATGIAYPPKKTTFYRCAISHRYRVGDGHIQGFYSDGEENVVTFDSVMFYQNGFKSNPMTEEDPKYDRFSRNVYQGGGAQMGFTYKNFISMDGGSGGPQMRFGGKMENSLIVEGYFFSATDSNNLTNNWLQNGNQPAGGTTAIVKDNVQLVYGFTTPMDPDSSQSSDSTAHPRQGYALLGASFGAVVEGNIISGAMLEKDLKGQLPVYGIKVGLTYDTYKNGKKYTQRNNVVRKNVLYNVAEGITLAGNATGVSNIVIEDNIIVAKGYGLGERGGLSGLSSSSQVLARNNKLYSGSGTVNSAWIGSGNVNSSYAAGLGAGKVFSDPDRTLKRYLLEVLKIKLLSWDDDPYMDSAQKADRKAKNEVYDPTGMRTFAAVALRMRQGGTVAVAAGSKPTVGADYSWDERFTAEAVVNWIRAGFDMSPVQ